MNGSDKEYYSVLGVERNASKDEIKRAFHKLARKYHPDNKATGDEKKFKSVNEAYQTLSDDRRRAEYDTYGHVFSGGSSGASSPFGDFGGFGFHASGERDGFEDFNVGDIFNEFFGGGMRQEGRRGRDISLDLEITFEESIFGTERNVLIGKTGMCDSCGGTGAEKKSGFDKCSTCNGKGRVHETRRTLLGTISTMRDCGTCHSSGKVPKVRCKECRGLGVVKKQEEVMIKIPAGIRDGEVIRLNGVGEAIPGGATGDLYARVHVGKHPVFRRDGANLFMNLDIKLSDALLGGEYLIQTLERSPLKIKIPVGVSFNEILRVRGRGVPIDGSRRGDLLVKINIKLPANLSRTAKQLVEKLRKEGM